MSTREDTLAHNLGASYFDDVMGYNSLTTIIIYDIAFEKSQMVIFFNKVVKIWNLSAHLPN